MDNPLRKRLLQACYSFLVPVARFLLMNGISYREFTELCRVAFVDVASTEFGLRGRKTNSSRISAMTGIGRKDVARVKALVEEYKRDPRVRLSPLSDVLHHWHTNPEFQDANGRPRALSITGAKDSFDVLVKRCVGDVPASAIRSELLRCKSIVLNDDGLLVLNRREVVPANFDEKLITSLSFNLRGLAETIAFNSNPDRRGDGRIERYVESDPLERDAREGLRGIVRSRITRFTEELDDTFSGYESSSAKNEKRIAVGVYYHEDRE